MKTNITKYTPYFIKDWGNLKRLHVIEGPTVDTTVLLGFFISFLCLPLLMNLDDCFSTIIRNYFSNTYKDKNGKNDSGYSSIVIHD